MKHFKYFGLIVATLVTSSLVSCNIQRTAQPTLDVNAVYTSVASTMISQMNDQLTQTAQAIPPTALASPTEPSTLAPLPTLRVESTNTPSSLNTPSLNTPVVILTPVGGTPVSAGNTTSSSTAVGCADSAFVQDTTIQDGTVMKAKTVFTKIWRLQNTGTCNWSNGFRLAFAYGSSMNGGSFTITQSKDVVAPGATHDFGIKLIAPTVPNTYTGCWKMQTDQGYWFGGAVCVTIKVTP